MQPRAPSVDILKFYSKSVKFYQKYIKTTFFGYCHTKNLLKYWLIFENLRFHLLKTSLSVAMFVCLSSFSGYLLESLGNQLKFLFHLKYKMLKVVY